MFAYYYYAVLLHAATSAQPVRRPVDASHPRRRFPRRRRLANGLRLQYMVTEWLFLRRCNLSNVGGRVYVRVRIRVSVILSIT